MLLEQLENALRNLICLCQHRLCRLEQDIVLGVGHHLFRYIRIADRGFRVLDILGHDRQVVDGMIQPVLRCAQRTADIRNLVDGRQWPWRRCPGRQC